MALRHMDMLFENKYTKSAIGESRKHIAWYIKGIKESSKVKSSVFKAQSKEEIESILYSFKESL